MRTRVDANRWAKIEAVLDEALAREPRYWPALLDLRCAGDRELRAELESLLGCADSAREFIESPPAIVAAALVAEEEAESSTVSDSYEGRRVGAYRIVSELGRGGMSRVFLAERADGGYTHHVALKLLRPGLDTEIDQVRFRAERQILASLSHPNIARLLDGGATDDGLPYLVIEYVDGMPIDAYAEARKLDLRQRIALFRTVCQATQYAHRNLVVHRDLKPSNIFVDHDGAVKLLDFGLAKLLEPGSYPGPALSQTTRRWMTPEYAAPEQIRGDAVTTLTDVYQLGAVLYELLTGKPPFADQAESIHVLEEAVLREEPLPPSTVAARGGHASAKSLRGDLDAIVLKALSKEPEQRFDSVEGLDRDLSAFLSGHPVRARRATASYRARRFVRRHRVESVAAIVVSISLIVGAAVSLSAAKRAEAERDRAARASRESEAVSSFLMRLFEASDPTETRGDTLTAEELVRRAAARAQGLQGEPTAQARMLEVTARLYRSLGKRGNEYDLLKRALVLRRQSRPVDSLEIARTLRLLSRSLISFRHSEADTLLRQALSLQERLLGPNDPLVASTLLDMASLSVVLGDLPRAEDHARRAVAINERTFGPNDSSSATSRLLLGSVLLRRGKLSEAEREYRSSWKAFEEALGPNHVEVAEVVLHLAYLLDESPGRSAEVEPLYRRGIEIRRRALGDAHPMVAYAMSDLSGLLARRGDKSAALALNRQALEVVRRAYGHEHPNIATMMHQVADRLLEMGLLTEAERFYRDAILMREHLFGAEHESVSGSQLGLARVLIGRRDYQSADSLIRRGLQVRRRTFGAEHQLTLIAEALEGMVLTRMGEYVRAEALLQHARELLERQVSRQSAQLRQVYGWLAELEDARGRPDEASRYRAIADGR